ncbi:AvrD family protein [Actinosynnema sp. NPDC051121]
MSSLELIRHTVDDFLGPAEKRFFSAGYRRVGYEFGEVTADRTGVATTLRLDYPADWSKKAAARGALPPHLSTVDAILLGAQLTELCLVSNYRLTAAQRRLIRLDDIRIKAGSAPDEVLDQVPVTASLVDTADHPGGRSRSTVDVTVGRMRVRCAAVHDTAEAEQAHGTHPSPEAVLGPAASRYYGTGFVRGSHRIDELSVDVERLRATASVTVHPTDADQGIEGAYQPRATAVDFFVTGLQLGQVLLYELDSMRRGASNTLWMRNTHMTLPESHDGLLERVPLMTAIENPKLIEMSGGVWRTADIVAELGGARFTCAVTHQLPNRI